MTDWTKTPITTLDDAKAWAESEGLEYQHIPELDRCHSLAWYDGDVFMYFKGGLEDFLIYCDNHRRLLNQTREAERKRIRDEVERRIEVIPDDEWEEGCDDANNALKRILTFIDGEAT